MSFANNNNDIEFENSKVKYIHKKLYPDNYASLYKSVSVCKSCFLIYSLLSDYFEELIKISTLPP